MRILLMTLLLLGVFCCGTDENPPPPPKLFAEYSIRYLQGENQLKAEATFLKGIHIDSADNIEPDGSIFMQNIQLTPTRNKNDNLHYQKEFVRVFEPEYTFTFVNDDEQTIDYPIKMSPIGNFSIENNTVSKTNGFTLSWDGDNLKENEELLVLLTDADNLATSHVIKGPTSNKSCDFPTTRMTKVTEGSGFLYLVKKQKNIEDKVVMIIESLAEYYTDKIDIEISK